MISRRYLARLLAAIVTAIGGATAHGELTAGQRQQILTEAGEAYDQGVSFLRRDPVQAARALETAVQRYRQLVDDGVVNGRLHYNLANAYLQSGEIGRAILHYRAAEKLIPGDPRLRRNLQYARTLRRSRIAPTGERALGRALLGWHFNTSATTRFRVFLGAYLAFWILLGGQLIVPHAAWRWLAGVTAALWIVFGASVAAQHIAEGGRRDGVVLVDEVIVRKGNSEGFEPQFEEALHQGVEFHVLEDRLGWLFIELPDGKTGWIRADQAGLLG